jgi:hypothetical protein
MKRGFLDLLDPSNDPDFFWQVISGPSCIFQYALLYEMFTEFQTSFLYKDTEPIFTREEFKELAPIVVIDCSKQKEELKKSPIDIRIEFETSVVIPNKLPCMFQ